MCHFVVVLVLIKYHRKEMIYGLVCVRLIRANLELQNRVK